MLILSYVRIAFLSLLLLFDQLGGEGFRRFRRRWRRGSAVRSLTVVSRGRRLAADLHAVEGAGPRPGIVLTHGVIESGKDDPRLVDLAARLAGCGFVVLVPELPGLKSLRLDMEESDHVAAAFRLLLSLDEVDEDRAGLFGFSFGVGPTLKAATDPSIREKVKFVVSFGGYFDALNVLRYVTTGRDEFRGHRHLQPPAAYARRVLTENLLHRVPGDRDRAILSRLLDDGPSDPEREASPAGDAARDGPRAAAGPEREAPPAGDVARDGRQAAADSEREAPPAGDAARDGRRAAADSEREAPPHSPDQLTEGGRAVYELVRNRDPARVPVLAEAVDPAVRDYLESLSLRGVAPQVKARVLIGHGDTDPLVPSTESLRLADALPDPGRAHAVILNVFTHVDARLSVRSIREFLTTSLPSCWRFYGLIFRILKQQVEP